MVFKAQKSAIAEKSQLKNLLLRGAASRALPAEFFFPERVTERCVRRRIVETNEA